MPAQELEKPVAVDPATQSKCKAATVEIDFDQIQGNIFGGFNKDHQWNIFLRIDDLAKARLTLYPADKNGDLLDDSIAGHVQHSCSTNVIAFNEQFRALRRAQVKEGAIKATWTNLVFTARGLQRLGLPDVERLPEAFKGTGPDGSHLGMVGRANAIGDIEGNAPDHWNDGMQSDIAWAEVDVAILVASDDPSQLDPSIVDSRAAKYFQLLEAPNSGITVLGSIRGDTRERDQAGHEHFGFKDGVSQPGVRGVDPPDDPLHNPDQGNPGQDLLHPGEFVVGYPRQIPAAEPNHEGPNRCPGFLSGAQPYPTDPAGSQKILPQWTLNGSFLVFRRLAQDVKGFQDAVADLAAQLRMPVPLLEAKLVGRYKSGAPLEALQFQAGAGEYRPPITDPGVTHRALANSSALNNNFEYEDDPDGQIVPLAAHIRKVYPRDQEPEFEDGKTISDPPDSGAAESRTQTHRLLRRGIPFGKSLGEPEGGLPDDPRGLLFFAYQSDIERQFEFVQTRWINDPNFPRQDAGQDPILANNTTESVLGGCPFHNAATALTFKHFVKTRGGQYFFSPSMDCLKQALFIPVTTKNAPAS